MIKFYYLREKKSRRPKGLVAIQTETGQIGWSLCAKDDRNQFNKELARKIATGRIGTVNHYTEIPHVLQPIAKDMIDYRERLTNED